MAGGAEALAAVGLAVGTPIQPMLAASAPGPADALIKSGVPAIVDVKLDGIRVQVHRRGDDVRIFTRSLDEITERLPEVVAAVRTIVADELVLDGEVLALRSDGRPEAFQLVASRTATHTTDADRAWRCGCSSSTCCTWTGAPCSTCGLTERVAELERLVPPAARVERSTVTTVESSPTSSTRRSLAGSRAWW